MQARKAFCPERFGMLEISSSIRGGGRQRRQVTRSTNARPPQFFESLESRTLMSVVLPGQQVSFSSPTSAAKSPAGPDLNGSLIYRQVKTFALSDTHGNV